MLSDNIRNCTGLDYVCSSRYNNNNNNNNNSVYFLFLAYLTVYWPITYQAQTKIYTTRMRATQEQNKKEINID
jgi:hypothetical protein